MGWGKRVLEGAVGGSRLVRGEGGLEDEEKLREERVGCLVKWEVGRVGIKLVAGGWAARWWALVG